MDEKFRSYKKIKTKKVVNIKESLLNSMKRIREIEMRISKEYSNQKMRCPVHLSIGQEAPSAALSMLINKKDFSVSTHRGHAHYLAKGGSLKALISEIYGKGNGCSLGKGGSMHLIDLDVNFMGTSAIVGNSIPTGTGLALAAKLNKENQISVIHIGDGAIEEGAFYESLNFAVVKEIPALYFCENNLYSVYSPLEVRQPKSRSIAKMSSAIGAYTVEGDGNCAISTYKNIKKAIDYCRSEKKPVFLELKTYRWLEHCGPNNDDHLEYRSKEEISFWRKKDPIKVLEETLNLEEKQKYNAFCSSLKKEIDIAFDYAEKSKPPSQDNVHTQIYAK